MPTTTAAHVATRAPRGRRRARRLALALLAAGAARVFAQAGAAPDEQARRLLEDGRAYRQQGKVKQALDNFNTIVSGFPQSDSVDDALLEIGRYHLEVERDVDKARAAFDKVAKQFPQSDGAPGAYHYLGLLTLQGATTQAELDDAAAQFTRVQRLYPRSAWVPRALSAEGLVLRRAGKLEEAIDAQRRVALEYPSSDAAPAAQFQIGHCLALLGRPAQAMEEYQRVRNRFPRDEWAAAALDRVTGLYRLHGFARPRFAPDSAFSVGAGNVLKDVRALLMTPGRTLWLASDKISAVVPFDAAGKMGAAVTAQDVKSLSLSPRDELVVTARLAVRVGTGQAGLLGLSVPSDKPGVPEPLEKLTAALVTPGGSLLVADGKRRRLQRFDLAGKHLGTWGDAREREVARLLLDGEGAVLAFDPDERLLAYFDETGKLLRSLPLRGEGFDLRKPLDVALDPAGNVYVADEQAGVVVLTPKGKLLARFGEELKKPRALTLDPTGAVLVYDERLERVLRYH
jgi:TolA-binding protein